jgi:hypothetical protein
VHPWAVIAVFIAALLAAACARQPANLPAGAIRIGEDYYMTPIGPDRDGCAQYTAFSRHRRVAQVIYYRARDGRFVTDKTQAACQTGKHREPEPRGPGQ